MIPESTVSAVRLMERWAAPYQAMIADEITRRHSINPTDPQITEAHKHLHALFLGVSATKKQPVRTLSGSTWNKNLKAFARSCGLSWNLASHQFRRNLPTTLRIANSVTCVPPRTLRSLVEDMTLGYAMDQEWGQHLDIELFEDIQFDSKTSSLVWLVDGWALHL
ncbi:hypothetical protein ULF88_24770 [Halopseudomonas pachastrellae]|nr:hypothetical protein [Halopseudomonas pachastrellae]